jgi:hypothetical protein
MAMQLHRVIPFGRTKLEYEKIFNLSAVDLDRSIIGVGDGPASFNAEMTALGKTVVSVDPLYAHSAAEIEARFFAVVDDVMAQVRASPDDWVWTHHRSPDDLRENRTRALRTFAADFERGRREGRYVTGELPRLPFEDKRFELALCSHLLFLYSAHFSYAFHWQSALEMLRMAREVRIFPLLTLDREPSPHLAPLVDGLRALGHEVSVEPVDYELQRGGKQMLRIRGAAERC